MHALPVKDTKAKQSEAATSPSRTQTPFQRARVRLRRNPLAMLGFWMLIALYGSGAVRRRSGAL